LVRNNPNKTELHVSYTVVVPLAEDDLASCQEQSAIFGCWKDQQINLSAKKPAAPMPRCNNFWRDNFSTATAFASVLQRLLCPGFATAWRTSRRPGTSFGRRVGVDATPI
jgi:hypothetical protein